MHYNIMVVDDSVIILETVKVFLEERSFDVKIYSSPLKAIEDLEKEVFDLVLSDFFMPEMNGDKFFQQVRIIDPEIPFLFMSTNEDIRIAIELMKMGADDYISKPIIKDALLFRIEKTLMEQQNRKIIDRVQKEQAIREHEDMQIVNWRNLYAVKDIKQTEQFIKLFSHTFTQSGVFILLDLFSSQIEKIDDDNYKINSHLANLLIEAGEKQEIVFNQINLINQIDDMTITPEKMDIPSMAAYIEDLCVAEFCELASSSNHLITFPGTSVKNSGFINIDKHYFKKILHELLCNASKYSPEGTEIALFFEITKHQENDIFSVIIRNKPRLCSMKDINNEKISGIPHEYSELVFDLFYRLDDAQVMKGEEWTGGVGLYVCRKLLGRQNGWISAKNGVDYTTGSADPFVQLTINLPFLAS